MSITLGSPFPTAGELAQFQADAESGMVDTCTIDRASSNPADPTRVVIYSGKCRVRSPTRAISDTPAPAGTLNDPHRFRVDIPVSVTGVQFRDHVTIDTAVMFPAMAGSDGYVTDPFSQSFASAQRLWCEERLR